MADNRRFGKLLEPGNIGPVKTRNRIVKPGAAMLYADENDTVMNPRVMAFYEAIARGGVGLVIVESPIVDYPIGARWRRRYRMDDDRYIQGMAGLVDMIKSHGCPVFMQMNHDGPWQTGAWGDREPLNTGQPIGSSAVSLKSMRDFHNQEPRPLTIEEIESIIDKFASAAVRGEQAGFQGVDINAGSSHLLHNFLSPYWNRRDDEYGGSRENRARFVVSIVREIKKRLGQDFPVCVTINGVEMGRLAGIADEKCITTEDALSTARMLKDAGADAIHVRSHILAYHVAGFFPEALFFPEAPFPHDTFPKGYDCSNNGKGAHVPLGAAIRKEVGVPIIAVGRLDPDLGEKALRQEQADFIALNRRLIADPELPNKLMRGETADIAPCTACQTCLEPSEIKRCRINARLGAAEDYAIRPAGQSKRVVVVGGGPAGMEAARVAALRGHKVTLFDNAAKLGGLLPIAATVKGTEIEDLPAIIAYLSGQMKKLGIEVKPGIDADAETIAAMNPDAVILAVGGRQTMPDIPGIDSPSVVSGPALHRKLKSFLRFLSPVTLRKLTKLYLPLGKKIVIIGGDKHGCELAEFLAKRGRQVTIVDEGEAFGEGMSFFLRCALLDWFVRKNVTTIGGVRCLGIDKRGLTIRYKDGKEQILEADNIVPVVPLQPNDTLLKELEGRVPEVYNIGDGAEPHLIVDAIAAGCKAGLSL